MTKTTKLSFYFLIFITFGLIGLWMPLLGDDLHWGTYFGSNYFPEGIFLTYDGRYLGDLLIIMMTKFKPIAFFAYSTFMTTIVYLVQKIKEQISSNKSLGLFSATLAVIMILLMPKMIFQQILGWHSGFANYVPSLLFPLFMLYLVLKNYDNKQIQYYRISTYLIFLSSIAAQFFAEHLTILNVCNSILVWLLLRNHFGKDFKKILNLILVGNFIGAILMFINGAYIKIIFGKDSYRSTTSAAMFDFMKTQFQPIYLLITGIIILIFAIIIIVYSSRVTNIKQKIANYSLLLSSVLAIAPFLVVSPFGSRCMFASYLFLITIFIINIDLLTEAYQKYLLPIIILIAFATGIRTDALAHNYGKTFNMQIQYSLYQNTVKRNTQYFLQYKNTDYISLNDAVQDDTNFAELYVKNNNRNKIPINYYDWTDVVVKLKDKKYKTQNDYMKAFDKQILKKVKLIQEKNQA